MVLVWTGTGGRGNKTDQVGEGGKEEESTGEEKTGTRRYLGELWKPSAVETSWNL